MSGDRLVMVSEWMANGNIDEYMRMNPYADRLGLVCFRSWLISLLTTDDGTIIVAERRR